MPVQSKITQYLAWFFSSTEHVLKLLSMLPPSDLGAALKKCPVITLKNLKFRLSRYCQYGLSEYNDEVCALLLSAFNFYVEQVTSIAVPDFIFICKDSNIISTEVSESVNVNNFLVLLLQVNFEFH